jgi:hypothetical protein
LGSQKLRREPRAPELPAPKTERNHQMPLDTPVAAGVLVVPRRLPMRIKVYNGSVANDENALCETCRHSTIIRGRTLDEEIVRCDAATMTPLVVTFRVTSCSAYSNDREPSYMEFLHQAWILRPGSSKRPAGFIRSSDLREDELVKYMRDRHDCFDE